MVTCERCQEIETKLRDASKRADEVYAVGNRAKPQMGHAVYFEHDGRTAICIAKERQS
jgi:hypothetical protein